MLQERTSSRRGVKKALLLVGAGTGIIFFVLSATGLWVQRELETRLKIQIEGKFEPLVFSPSFYLRKSRFTWKNKVEFISGDLKVGYRFGRLLSENILRLKLEGKNLEVEFLDEWASSQGVGKVTLKSFYADFDLDPEGLKEIYALDAESPSFQFRIQRTENKSKTPPAGGEKL